MVSADFVDPDFDDLDGAELEVKEEFGHFADND